MQKFEDLIVWNKARILTTHVYKNFGHLRDFSFRDQIQRAAVSIINNIAEGFERQSQKELKQFLFIAKGSCGELRSMLYLALDLGFISKEKFDFLLTSSLEVSKILFGIIRKINI